MEICFNLLNFVADLIKKKKLIKQKPLINLLFSFLIISSLYAQSNPKIDSLKRVINNSKGEQKADLLIQLAEQFYTVSPDSVYYYAFKSLNIAKTLKTDKTLARAYNSLGVSYYNKMQNDSAKYYYAKSLEINKHNNNDKGIAVNLANLGTVFFAKSDYISALENYLEASEYQEKLGDDSFGTLSNIGLLLSNLDRHEEALKYLKRDLVRAEKSDDLNKQIPSHVNLASEYIKLKNYDSAYYHANFALKESKKLNMNYGIGKSLTVMASTCIGLKRYNEGLIHINNSILKFKELNIQSEILNGLVVKARLLEKDKKYLEVLKVVEEAKIESNNNPDLLYYFSEPKYMALKALGRFDEALQTYEEFVQEKDSLFGEDTRKQIVTLEQKYKHEKSQRKIERLTQEALLLEVKSKQRMWLFLAIAGLLLLVIGGILFFVWKNQITNKMKLLQIEQRLNRARINPHFFFNALASMQTLALTSEKSKIASYISKFASVMRKALDSSYEEMVSIEEELNFMKEYLEVQQLRFPNKFEHKINCDESLELDELKIPSMLLQPFVENSIEHGFKSSEEKGQLTITINDLNEEIIISVEDNGKEKSIEKPKKHKSRALKIIKDRLVLFNKRFKSKASYYTSTNNQNKGYKVTVTLPKVYNI